MTSFQFKKIIMNGLLVAVFLLSACLIWNEHREINNIQTTRLNRVSTTTESSFMPLKIVDKLHIPDATEFKGIIERPLFNINRRPSFNSSPAELTQTDRKKAKTKAKAQLLLNAIVISPDRKLAIFQSGKNAKPEKVILGDSINNWVLSEISPHSVRLSRGRQVKVLELEVKTSKWTKPSEKPGTKPANKTSTKTPQAKPAKEPETDAIKATE